MPEDVGEPVDASDAESDPAQSKIKVASDPPSSRALWRTGDGVGGDDAADCLRYLVGTRERKVTQRKLRGL